MKSGTDWLSPEMLKSVVLPVLAMSFGTMAGLMRYTRAESLLNARQMNICYFLKGKRLTRRTGYNETCT